jgi:hypothetical protein
MGIENSMGHLTPKELKTLYIARVDCHLIHSCEVCPDSEDIHVKALFTIQVEGLFGIPIYAPLSSIISQLATPSHQVTGNSTGMEWVCEQLI